MSHEHEEDLRANGRCVVCGAEPGMEDPDCPQCGSDVSTEEPLPCRFCGELVNDEQFAESDQDDAHQKCIDDNYEPPEPDYDAPSMTERMEMDWRRKEELR